MARQARKLSKSGNYYIVLGGSELFVTKEDKDRFLEIVSEKLDKVYGVEITKTEIRMAVKESEKGISMDMKSVTTIYARYFNRANNREGKLFEGRFKSEPLESKNEIDECVSSLAAIKPKAKPSVKKAAAKSAPEKEAKPKTKAEPKKEEPKQKPKSQKNLPSWLL